MNRRAIVGDVLKEYLLWIILLIIALSALIIIIAKKLLS